MGGLGIISQLLLCKTLQPDFQQEEICSIEKDSDEIMAILKEMQEYMPQVRIKEEEEEEEKEEHIGTHRKNKQQQACWLLRGCLW